MTSDGYDQVDEVLPEPHDGMTPEEKGELLLRYVEAGKPVAQQEEAREVPPGSWRAPARWTRLNFSGALLQDHDFKGQVDLTGANLRRANLAGTTFLPKSSFREADLRDGDLTGVDAGYCEFWGANLNGTNLSKAHFVGARLRGTILNPTCVEGADFRRAVVDESTYSLSGWSPADLVKYDALGLEIDPFDHFPYEATRALALVHAISDGLTLTFDTRLHRFDPTAFDAFIAQVLGPDTDVTIEQRSNINMEGPSFIRINGSRPEDLVAVAEAFYDRVWRETDNSLLPRGLAVLLARMELLREQVSEVQENVGILGNADVQEMLEDQGAAHVFTKDKKLLQTRFQRVAGGVAQEVQRRTVGKLGNVIQGEVEDGVGGLLEDGTDDEG